MQRRLFFLFPDTEHAQQVVDELTARGLSRRRIHAIARDVDLGSLPQATALQKSDAGFRIERVLWNLDLMLFFAAAIALIASLVLASVLWAAISVLVMALTFFAGQRFATRVPDVHLTEFTDALAHGEILLMVDVPRDRVAEIEDYVHGRHPEAVVGGVGWSTGMLGV